MTDETETKVDEVSRAVDKNLEAMTPTRILALYAFFGFLYIGVELGSVDVPFTQALLATVYFALAAAHTYKHEAARGVDLVVAGYVSLAGVLVGVQTEFLAVPFGPDWTALVIVTLIMADGYVISREVE